MFVIWQSHLFTLQDQQHNHLRTRKSWVIKAEVAKKDLQSPLLTHTDTHTWTQTCTESVCVCALSKGCRDGTRLPVELCLQNVHHRGKEATKHHPSSKLKLPSSTEPLKTKMAIPGRCTSQNKNESRKCNASNSGRDGGEQEWPPTR